MEYIILFSIISLLVGSAMGRPPTGVYPHSDIGLFPIEECPVNTLFPQVIILPSVNGQQLASNQYVVCYGGVPHVFNCSEGLFFNWETMSCDFPYELRSSRNETSVEGNLDLIPVGPIQVPTSPQFPIPFLSRRLDLPHVRPPVYPYPITKPNLDIIMPLPILPAHPLPPAPRPVPYY